MTTQQFIEIVRYLLKGLEDLTLTLSEYLLVLDLIEWHKQHKIKASIR